MIAISMGDPAGIGPEVILKAAASILDRNHAPLLVVIGDMAVMRAAAKRIHHAPEIAPHPLTPSPFSRGGSRKIWVVPVSDLSMQDISPGKPSVASGDASYRYVIAAAKMALAGEVDALVTAPISKEWWYRAGHRFPGHTELLAKLGGARQWRMMFAGSALRLGLVTVHIGLEKVASMLTLKNVLDTIVLLDRHLRESEGFPRPRIGVLGFNPHAGENGLFGSEEASAIGPAIERARRRGIDAFGPLAPDTAFIRRDGRFGFDAAVAMYHDQGLIPLKTLEFDRAVNVTLGLPFIRTSPDHGTAFDIAGQNRASPSSMIAAIEYAIRAIKQREAAGRRAA